MSEGNQFSNEFGAVFPDRIVVCSKKSWFSGGSQEDLPLRHVTSIRMETSRNIFGGIVLLLIGLASLSSGSGGVMLVGLVLGALGVILLIGWPKVSVNTAGNDLQVMTGTFLQKDAAQQYVSAVKKALFAKP
ncbi:MAG: hypothetical protein JSR60_16370 [Proteobacteria bacterium]|nr:hypothetical protein [Pseudomonadota bacterium]